MWSRTKPKVTPQATSPAVDAKRAQQLRDLQLKKAKFEKAKAQYDAEQRKLKAMAAQQAAVQPLQEHAPRPPAAQQIATSTPKQAKQAQQPKKMDLAHQLAQRHQAKAAEREAAKHEAPQQAAKPQHAAAPAKPLKPGTLTPMGMLKSIHLPTVDEEATARAAYQKQAAAAAAKQQAIDKARQEAYRKARDAARAAFEAKQPPLTPEQKKFKHQTDIYNNPLFKEARQSGKLKDPAQELAKKMMPPKPQKWDGVDYFGTPEEKFMKRTLDFDNDDFV